MMKKKNRTGKKPVLNANTRTDVLALIEHICKSLKGSYGSLPPEITLQINPQDFATTAAELSDEQPVAQVKIFGATRAEPRATSRS
jgi:hypothetical protein